MLCAFEEPYSPPSLQQAPGFRLAASGVRRLTDIYYPLPDAPRDWFLLLGTSHRPKREADLSPGVGRTQAHISHLFKERVALELF